MNAVVETMNHGEGRVVAEMAGRKVG